MSSLFRIGSFLRAAEAALQFLSLPVAAALAVDQRRADRHQRGGRGDGPAAQRRDHVARALAGVESDRWLPGHFEFVELAVDPAFQRRGVGGCLHDLLIAGRTEGRALLSTIDQPTPALVLYERRGWVTLRRNFHFAGGDKPYRIMGLRFGAPPGGGGR